MSTVPVGEITMVIVLQLGHMFTLCLCVVHRDRLPTFPPEDAYPVL